MIELFELIFVDRETGEVKYAITNVTRVHYITPSEVGFEADGWQRSTSFSRSEKLQVDRIQR